MAGYRARHFRHLSLGLRSLLIALTMLFGSSAETMFGAEIRASDSKLCVLALEGIIAEGDYERLRSILNSQHLDEFDERTTTICLRSAGGSFDEAARIGELIYDKGLSTIVVDRAACYSACAVIFMSGVITDRAAPYRKMSAKADLGFHAPYVSVGDGRYTKGDVEAFSQDVRRALLFLLRLSAKRTQLAASNFLKKSLLIKILESGPNEMSMVKTVGDAARWNIDVYDADHHFQKPADVDAIKNICNNFHYSNMDEGIAVPPDLSVRVEQYASKYHAEDGRVLVINSRTGDTVCEIYPRIHKGRTEVSFFACSYDYWSSNSFGDCRQYKNSPLFGQPVPSFFQYHPDTRLGSRP